MSIVIGPVGYGSSGNAAPAGVIVFRPGGGTVTGDRVATSAELKTLIAATVHDLTIIVDGSLATPTIQASDGIIDCRGLVTVRGNTPYTTLTVAAGAELLSLKEMDNLTLKVPSTGTASLDFAYDVLGTTSFFKMRNRAILSNTTGSAASVTVPAGKTLVVSVENHTNLQAGFTGSAGKELFDLATATSSLEITTSGQAYVANNSIKGIAGSTCALLLDNGLLDTTGSPYPTFASFAGTLSFLQVLSGLRYGVVVAAKTAAYTAHPGELVRVDTSGGNVTITLPSGQNNGTLVTVKSTAVSANAITVAGTGATVDGGASDAISSATKACRTYVFDNGDWAIVGSFA